MSDGSITAADSSGAAVTVTIVQSFPTNARTQCVPRGSPRAEGPIAEGDTPGASVAQRSPPPKLPGEAANPARTKQPLWKGFALGRPRFNRTNGAPRCLLRKWWTPTNASQSRLKPDSLRSRWAMSPRTL